LLVAYENHVLEEDEGVISVKKNNYIFLKKTQKKSIHEASILRIDRLQSNELICDMS
jgi:hypothetical protein